IEPMFACEAYGNQVTDPVAYVISANIKRRHLTTEQKRELIAKLIKAQPEKSSRQVAKVVGVSHTTSTRYAPRWRRPATWKRFPRRSTPRAASSRRRRRPRPARSW